MKEFKKDGITIYYEVENRYRSKITNIEIEPGAKTVEIVIPNTVGTKFVSVYMPYSMKTFPDVETLIIGENLDDIDIPNHLFPNVKRVMSNSEFFLDEEPVIIQRYGYGSSASYTLLNTFCKKKDEKVCIEHLCSIQPYAFQGCMSTDIEFKKGIIDGCINKKSFKGFAYTMRPDKTIAFDNLIVSVGGDSNGVADLTKFNDKVLAKLCEFKCADRIIASNIDAIKRCSQLVGTLEIRDNRKMSPKKVSTILKTVALECKDIIFNSDYFKTVDEAIYTIDGKELVFTSPSKTGVFKIPNEVKKIHSFAISSKGIEEIIMPDSIEDIDSSSIIYCESLKNIEFGKNIQIFGENSNMSGEIISNSFGAKNLIDEIRIPESTILIGRNAFRSFNGKVFFNNKVKIIGANAFSSISNKSVELPATLSSIDKGNFCNVEEFILHSLPDGFEDCIFRNTDVFSEKYFLFDSDFVTVVVFDEKKFYVPRYAYCTLYESLYTGDYKEILMSFNKIKDPLIKYLTAVKLYELTKDPDVGSYIRKASSRMIERLFDLKRDDLIIKIIEFELLTKNAVSKILKKAEAYELTSITAYALKETEKTKLGDSFSL